MHRRRASTLVILFGLVLGVSVIAAATVAACSVTLDTSRLNADTGTPGGEAGPSPVLRPCAQDSDCSPAAGGCTAGHCGTAPDGTPNVCLFDQCATGSACVAASCTSNKCGAPAQYHFNAGSFVIDAGIACTFAGNYQYYQAIPQPCVAAIYPFLFVRTTTSILAFDVADPTTSAPPPVDFTPIPFSPSQMFTSGRRLYFVSPTTDTSSDAISATIAWVDVPLDPSVRSLTPTLTTLIINKSNLDSSTVFALPGPTGQLFVIVNDYALLIDFPPADATRPLQLFKMVSLPAPETYYFVASSGPNLVTFGVQYSSTEVANGESLSLETGAGTASSLNIATNNMAGTYGALQEWTTATGDNGALVFSGAPVFYTDAGAAYEGQVQVGWALPNAQANSFNVGPGSTAVLSAYPPAGGGFEGPLALSDPNTAVAVAYSQADKTPEVFVVTSDAGGSPTVGSKYPISFNQQSVALAASGGYAYLVEPVTVDSTNVVVFAPACQ